MTLKSHKDDILILCACFLFVVGSGLLIAALSIPPVGEIHSSVLISSGEAFTFASALLGIGVAASRRVNDIMETLRKHGLIDKKDQ